MTISEGVTYTITFLAVYVQVFFLVTFLERRRELGKAATKQVVLKEHPRVAVIVPCWNEEKTVHGTIESLLALNYPKEKLEIVIVDDGSTDSTWQEILMYENHPQIKIFHKENGGKHTAVNFGIEHTDTPFIACLDADSFVDKEALALIMATFQQKPDVMAVAPSIIIFRPKTLIQRIQKVEYNMGIYIKKMLAFLNAIHVTPGPFSVFRREVFVRMGGFRKAHNTEDMEIAYRMQQNHMKIDHCHTAFVYTVAPDTFMKLYRQRLRWIYGFIQNTLDYRHLIFKRTHGNFSFFTLPSGVISISAAVFIFGSLVYNFIVFVLDKITQWRVSGISLNPLHFQFDWFYINTQTIMFVVVILYGLLIFSMIAGTRMAKQKLNLHIISYIVVYSVIAPLWLMKAIWNSLTARKPSWR
jgi:cellulose synthase/poly-beta-1,6-N-acetylglucosamine synthase-like glycosyltransferase